MGKRQERFNKEPELTGGGTEQVSLTLADQMTPPSDLDITDLSQT